MAEFRALRRHSGAMQICKLPLKVDNTLAQLEQLIKSRREKPTRRARTVCIGTGPTETFKFQIDGHHVTVANITWPVHVKADYTSILWMLTRLHCWIG